MPKKSKLLKTTPLIIAFVFLAAVGAFAFSSLSSKNSINQDPGCCYLEDNYQSSTEEECAQLEGEWKDESCPLISTEKDGYHVSTQGTSTKYTKPLTTLVDYEIEAWTCSGIQGTWQGSISYDITVTGPNGRTEGASDTTLLPLNFDAKTGKFSIQEGQGAPISFSGAVNQDYMILELHSPVFDIDSKTPILPGAPKCK